MNNEWKMVPVEPTKEQTLAVCMHPDLARSLYRAMVLAAPMPPDGDVEGIMISLKDHKIGQAALLEHIESLKADRTCLTAERDGLRNRLESARARFSRWNGRLIESLRDERAENERLSDFGAGMQELNDHLQSELTKALEELRLEKLVGAAMQHQAEDVRAVGDEPVAFHMGEAMAIEKLLKVEQVSRHVRNEDLGPMGATIVTEYTTKVGLRLVTEHSNGGCSAYLHPIRPVVLPERFDIPHSQEYESADYHAAAVHEADTWNACLDAVEALNK